MSRGFHRALGRALRNGTALAGLAAAGLLAQQSSAVTVNDAYTPTEIIDTENITGVGQMVVDLQNGYIGLCTVSLINPRTVIFASHCVNENPDETAFQPGSAYGTAFGGMPIGFGFQAYNRPGIRNWLLGGYNTSTTDQFYNSNYVVYNPAATNLGVGLNFLQADVALAALDTPAVGIPTWTMLFSPLDGATHATIEGYGMNGTGTDGDIYNIDYRRRVAENTISVLGSLDEQDLFLFGPPLDGLPQNLYMLDFNDPKFGTAEANAYDFNIYHDAALEKEGITAPGDSGGPLVVDQLFSQPVIAAVLSGGSRFFYEQPPSSYGSTSFYQPLYLFWDWVVANNPYKYVSAKSGDGDWFDPNHWVMNLDPNYLTVVDGQLVNALPTTPAQGVPAEGEVNTPKFGSVCYFNDCLDLATGGVYTAASASDTLSGGPAKVQLSSLLGSERPASAAGSTSSLARVRALFAARGFVAEPMAATEGSATVGGETVVGAPGSSNFVPDDDDGDPTVDRPPRYYDVTLSAAGTTTLDGNIAIIDRLTINGANAGLRIGPEGGLGTLIDTTVYAGNFEVDGLYLSAGDIAMMGGVLSGDGAVVAPYTTAVLGTVAPGRLGSTGTLTVVGNVVLSSHSALLTAMSPTSNSILDVYGELSLGGAAVFAPVGGYVPRYHESHVFATADTVSGAFASVPDTIAGVLYPTVHQATVETEGASYVEEIVTFEAGSFGTLLTNPTDDQLQVGRGLDAARQTSYGSMIPLFDAVDPLADGPLANGLDSLLPNNGRSVPYVGQLLTQNFTGLAWQHLGEMGAAARNGQVAFNVQTGALQMAQDSSLGSYQTRRALAGLASLDRGPVAPIPAEGTGIGSLPLPKGMGGFLAGSVIDGAVSVGGGTKADVEGFIVGGGFDLPVATGLRLGASLAFAQASTKLRNAVDQSYTNTVGGMLYLNYNMPEGWFMNAFAGGSAQTVSLTRDAVVGPATFHLTAHTDGSTPMAGVQAGKYLEYWGITFAPAAGMQYQRANVSGYSETGGPAAVAVQAYGVTELDLRLGFDAYGSVDAGQFVVKPNLHAFLVDNVAASPNRMVAAFVTAPNALMTFGMGPTGGNHAWAELGIGAEVDCGCGAMLGLHYNAAIGRPETRYGAWTGKVRIAL